MNDSCKHIRYSASTKMVYTNVSDLGITQLTMKIRVVCADCKRPYVFKGQIGFSTSEPMCSPDGSELRVPICHPDNCPDTEEEDSDKRVVH